MQLIMDVECIADVLFRVKSMKNKHMAVHVKAVLGEDKPEWIANKDKHKHTKYVIWL